MLEDIIGQKKAKETVRILLESTSQINGPFPHTLLIGPAGVGKSSFARGIAKALNHKFTEVNSSTTGQPAESKIKLMIALEEMKENDILFLDEIHALSKHSQDLLLTTLENNYFNYGEYLGGRVEVKPFTLLGATTDLSGLSTPLQSRFKYVIYLEEYSKEEIEQILRSEAEKLRFNINTEYLAEYCRRNPRTAKNYLDWIRRYCITNKLDPSCAVIEKAMRNQGVYKYGLSVDDLRYIELLKQNRVMGVRSIANTLNIPEKTVKTKIEPYLLKLRLINILSNMQNKRSINKQELIRLGL